MNILVQSSFFSEEFSESSPEGKQFIQAHPECDWRFLSYKECSDEDLAWADVIYGTPDPASLKSAVRLRWLHLMTAGVNNYSDPGLFLDLWQSMPSDLLWQSGGVFPFCILIKRNMIGTMKRQGASFLIQPFCSLEPVILRQIW